MDDNATTLIHIDKIETEAAMGFALTRTREYCKHAGWVQPPLPENPAALVPCALLITQTDDHNGRIQFFRPDQSAAFDERWTLKEPRAGRR